MRDQSFGDRLRRFREERGMTQADVAQSCGIPVAAISHFETGRRFPNYWNLKKLCIGMDLKPEYLMGLKSLETGLSKG